MKAKKMKKLQKWVSDIDIFAITVTKDNAVMVKDAKRIYKRLNYAKPSVCSYEDAMHLYIGDTKNFIAIWIYSNGNISFLSSKHPKTVLEKWDHKNIKELVKHIVLEYIVYFAK